MTYEGLGEMFKGDFWWCRWGAATFTCLVSPHPSRNTLEKFTRITYKDKHELHVKAEARSEYAEMNISKLHLRIDELEDEIIREKLKINAVSGQLDDTFNEMLNKY